MSSIEGGGELEGEEEEEEESQKQDHFGWNNGGAACTYILYK
jgi:hypothetical protein